MNRLGASSGQKAYCTQKNSSLCSLCAASCKEACRHVMTNCNQTAGDTSANLQTSASEAGVVCLPCIRLTVDLNVFAVISTCVCVCVSVAMTCLSSLVWNHKNFLSFPPLSIHSNFTCCICFKYHQSVVEEVADGTLRREFRLFIHLFIFYFCAQRMGQTLTFEVIYCNGRE